MSKAKASDSPVAVTVVDRSQWLTCGRQATIHVPPRRDKIQVVLPTSEPGVPHQQVSVIRVEGMFTIQSDIVKHRSRRRWTLTAVTVSGIPTERMNQTPTPPHTGEISYTWVGPDVAKALKWLPPFVGETTSRWENELNGLSETLVGSAEAL